MPEIPGAGRLDPEILAAYVDGLLPPEERAKVEAEIAADPESYEWVVNTINAVDDPAIVATIQMLIPAPGPAPAPTPEPPPTSERHRLTSGGANAAPRVLPFYRRRAVQGVMGTLVAAAAALVMVVRTQPTWWRDIWGPSVDSRFAKLVEAVGEERYIEARLTGGFKYGPLRPVMRGPGDLSHQNLQLLAAAGELQKAAEREPSAENLHAWGVAQLLLGQHESAINVLERARLEHGASAALSADLSAAYLADGGLNGQASQFPRALNSALEALEADPRSQHALFNKALSLERMGLEVASDEAWRDFLAVETDAAWRAEAERHLASRRRPQSKRWRDLRDRLVGREPMPA